MLKRLRTVVAAALVVTGSMIGSTTSARSDDAPDAGQFLTLLNQLRASTGVAPLNVDPRLVQVAQAWSDHMAADGTLAHNPNLATQAPSGWTVLGENVGVGGDVSALHNAFVNSPEHYRNMVDGRFNSVGIAVTPGPGVLWVTVDFEANPRAQIASAPPPPTPPAPTNSTGYWLAGRDGGMFGFAAAFHGSLGARRLSKPIVGAAARSDHQGYWFVAADGGVFACDAGFFGSTGAQRLSQPMVAMTGTPSGNGYWLVARDGGIFNFGDAQFRGSMGGTRLAQPVVGVAGTPSGNGYWLVARDGGIFSFGDAHFYGSSAGISGGPIVGMAATPTGRGYWLADAAGGVYSFGDAGFAGSAAPLDLSEPIVGVAAA